MANIKYMKAMCIVSTSVLLVIYVFVTFGHTAQNKLKLFVFSINEPMSYTKNITHQKHYDITKNITNNSTHTTHTKNSTSVQRIGCPTVSLMQLENAKTSKNNIPLLFHQVYIYNSEKVPSQYIPLIQGCRKVNQDLTYLFWTNAAAQKLIEKFYPQYLQLYNSYPANVMKSDFLRVMILYHFGGIYADMDVECRKPFSEHIDKFNAGAIIDQERRMQTRVYHNMNYTAMNSVMISQKKHPFMKFFLEKYPGQAKRQNNVLWKTGPFFLKTTYEEYLRLNKTGMEKVHLASSTWFTPLVDGQMVNVLNSQCHGSYAKMRIFLRLGCVEWDKLGRKQDVESTIKDSVLVHKFLHLAYAFAAKGIRQRIDLCKAVNISKPLL